MGSGVGSGLELEARVYAYLGARGWFPFVYVPAFGST